MTTITKPKNATAQTGILNLLLDDTKPYYHIWRIGLLTGIILLYIGVIGMIEAFNNREIIREGLLLNLPILQLPSLTLGQLVLVLPGFIGGYLVVRRLRDHHNLLVSTLAAGAVGLLSALPTILVLLLVSQLELRDISVRDMFVNINRDWLEIVTFDHRAPEVLWQGILILFGLTGLAGLIGGGLQSLPDKIRSSVIFGLAFTLLIATMGVTVRLVLQEIVPRDLLDIFFRRDTMLVNTALGLFIMGTAFVWMPPQVRRSILFGLLVTLAVEGVVSLLEVFVRSAFAEGSPEFIFPGSETGIGVILYLGIPFVAGLLGRLYYEYRSRDTAEKPADKTAGVGLGQNVARMDIIVLVIILMVAPWLVGRALSDVMVTIGIFVLMGIGLNVAIGLAGLLDLGYVTNYAVGAYVLAVLTSTGPLGLVKNGYVNFWVVLPIALLAAMFAGFVFAVPVLKMRGDYLAIATLGFGEIIGRLAKSDALAPIIGGAQGMSFIPKPALLGIELKNPEQLYYIILGACVVTLIVSIRLNNSRIGRQWMAIREDEDVASAMGIDVAQSKLLAFTISAATGGVAGAIFAAKVGTVFPNSFEVFVSINVLSLIIVGGMGSNPGIVLGAIVLMGLPELLREFTDFRWLMYGILLIWMMLNRPEGLWPSQVTQREMQEALPPAASGSD